MIKNEPKKYVGDYNVDAVRDAYENRGRWYYFLVKEGLEQGLPLEFARDAMHEAGLFLGKMHLPVESLARIRLGMNLRLPWAVWREIRKKAFWCWRRYQMQMWKPQSGLSKTER